MHTQNKEHTQMHTPRNQGPHARAQTHIIHTHTHTHMYTYTHMTHSPRRQTYIQSGQMTIASTCTPSLSRLGKNAVIKLINDNEFKKHNARCSNRHRSALRGVAHVHVLRRACPHAREH
jgi:hypothetical protein